MKLGIIRMTNGDGEEFPSDLSQWVNITRQETMLQPTRKLHFSKKRDEIMR